MMTYVSFIMLVDGNALRSNPYFPCDPIDPLEY